MTGPTASRDRLQVAIVGAGTAGLMLSHLSRAKASNRSYSSRGAANVEAIVGAGVLARTSVAL